MSAGRYEAPMVTFIGRVNSRPGAVVDAESVGGWVLRIVRRENGAFDSCLVNPFGTSPYESHFRATLEEAIEKACDYLRDVLAQPAAAAALRTLATVEVSPR